ncbi:MAG TPA: hypothetical protein VFW33_19130 [Gemmataceae bacterium]|nr:hypothetical protein [Gemmataceae bacterium]
MIAEQAMLQKKLHYLLHRCLVDARNLALAKDHQKVFDLADTFEILPSLMEQWEDGHLDLVRAVLRRYQEKCGGQGFDYLSILDMGDGEFEAVYASW